MILFCHDDCVKEHSHRLQRPQKRMTTTAFRGEVKRAGLGEQQTLVEKLTAAIQAEILEGRLRPGDRLEELVLSRKYDVSRTPIREALRQLASARLVEIRPRMGAVVASPTAGEVIDLFELVAELEGMAARLATERLKESDLPAIKEAHALCQMAARGQDAALYYSVNRKFHHAIHCAAKNLVLLEEIEALDKRLSPYRRFITFRAGRTQTALREHDKILHAIQQRDPTRAGVSMRDHVRILGEDTTLLVKGLKIG
jgi:DNA-binding GntR family transcriptional regulator